MVRGTSTRLAAEVLAAGVVVRAVPGAVGEARAWVATSAAPASAVRVEASIEAPALAWKVGITSGGSGNCASGGIEFFQPLNPILNRYGRTLVTG